jgi:hypothetical protein
MDVALVTTLLAQRSQIHRPTLSRHPDQWRLKMTERLRRWTNHFVSQLIPFMHRVRSRPGARARRSGEENEEGARDPCLAARAD